MNTRPTDEEADADPEDDRPPQTQISALVLAYAVLASELHAAGAIDAEKLAKRLEKVAGLSKVAEDGKNYLQYIAEGVRLFKEMRLGN